MRLIQDYRHIKEPVIGHLNQEKAITLGAFFIAIAATISTATSALWLTVTLFSLVGVISTHFKWLSRPLYTWILPFLRYLFLPKLQRYARHHEI